MSVEIRGSLRLPWQCHQPSWVPPQECSHGKGALQRSWLELLSPRGKNLERSSSNFKGDATNTLILTALARTSKGIIYSSFIIILPIPVHPRRHSLASSQKFRSPQSKPLAACTGNPKILRDKETEQSPSDADIVVNLLGNFFQNKKLMSYFQLCFRCLHGQWSPLLERGFLQGATTTTWPLDVGRKPPWTHKFRGFEL